jgi:uncharacterized damage-inducible protein DinB
MHDDFPSLFAFNRWANAKMLDACRRLTSEQYAAEPAPGWSSVRASVVHIASATRNWVRRLAGEVVSGVLTEAEAPTVEDAQSRLEQADRTLEGLWPTFTPERLAAPWTFTLRGQSYVLPPWVVLRHIVNHTTYHRGQVSSKLKGFGVQQPETDLVFWAVEQVPQPK